jgi:hypothetical protein
MTEFELPETLDCKICKKQPSFIIKGGTPFWTCESKCECNNRLVSRGRWGNEAHSTSIYYWNTLNKENGIT